MRQHRNQRIGSAAVEKHNFLKESESIKVGFTESGSGASRDDRGGASASMALLISTCASTLAQFGWNIRYKNQHIKLFHFRT
jgi:hypothetical protein